MSFIRQAIFLFPTDQMGGAERVTRMLAGAALHSGNFDKVTCFVLSRASRGTLNSLATDPRLKLVYTEARSEIRGLPKLIRTLTSERYQLVFSSHAHLNAAASLLRGLGILQTKRLVTRESTMIFERDLGWRGQIIRQLYKFYGKQDLIICQTKRMAESFAVNTSGKFATRTITIPNPIDLDTVAAARTLPSEQLISIPKAAYKIVWCGRLSPVKFPLRAIDTLAVLHHSGRTNVHLVMIGDGPLRSEIIAYAQALKLSRHVTLTGYHSAPAALMQHCHVGLMTSDIEGFPNVILEMLAAGVSAVITTDCAGDLNEIPGVYIARSSTPAALAETLIPLLVARKQHQGEGIVNFLLERSPENFLRKLLEI